MRKILASAAVGAMLFFGVQWTHPANVDACGACTFYSHGYTMADNTNYYPFPVVVWDNGTLNNGVQMISAQGEGWTWAQPFYVLVGR